MPEVRSHDVSQLLPNDVPCSRNKPFLHCFPLNILQANTTDDSAQSRLHDDDAIGVISVDSIHGHDLFQR